MTPASSCLWPGTWSRTQVLVLPASVLSVRVVSGRAIPSSRVLCVVWNAICSVVVVGWAGLVSVLGDGIVLLAWAVLRRTLTLWLMSPHLLLLVLEMEVSGRPALVRGPQMEHV